MYSRLPAHALLTSARALLTSAPPFFPLLMLDSLKEDESPYDDDDDPDPCPEPVRGPRGVDEGVGNHHPDMHDMATGLSTHVSMRR